MTDPRHGVACLPADWPAPPGVVAFTTLRHGAGVSEPPFDHFNLGLRAGDDAAAVQRNRAELIERFRLPSAPWWLRQVHGTGVVRVTHPHPNPPPQAGEGAASPLPLLAGAGAASPLPPLAGEGRDGGEPEADAAVTDVPGTVLAILTADCLPVVFAARDGSEVAAAHAGWRGLSAGVLEATVAAIRAAPDDLVAWLGPAAGPRAYEVGQEVFDAFTRRDPRAATAFVATRPGHWRVDLYALARQRLAEAGVREVHGGGLCTISDPARFYSHRRSTIDGSGRGGRMATLAWIAP